MVNCNMDCNNVIIYQAYLKYLISMQSITITFLNQLSLGIQTLQKCVLFMLQKTSLLIPPCVCQYATSYNTLNAEALNASLRLYLNQMS